MQAGGKELCTQARAGLPNCLYDERLVALQFLFAKGAVGRLEGRADEQRVFPRVMAGVAEDFARAPVDEFGDLKGGERVIDRLPRYVLIKDEREVAAHGLEPGDFTRDRLTKREFVKAIG